MGLKTCYANPHTQKYHPQFDHHQMNPGRAIFKASDAQQVQTNSKTKPLDSEDHFYNPHNLHHFPANVHADHLQHPHADPRRFGQLINSRLQQQMPVSNKFSSPHQVRGLPRDSFSPHHINEMAYNHRELHPTQYFPSPYHQQNSRGLGMPIPAAANKHFELDKIKADASFSYGWPCFKSI